MTNLPTPPASSDPTGPHNSGAQPGGQCLPSAPPASPAPPAATSATQAGASEDAQPDLPGVARQIRQPSSGRKPPAGFQARFDPNLSDMVIDERISGSMNTVLRQLVRDSHASSGMVLDRAGQIIVWDGTNYQSEMMMLGALIAGTYASTREMARILHEDNFRMLLQEGAKEKIFTEAVGDQWLVSIIFDRHTHLGLVKVLCNRATSDLSEILRDAIETNKHRPRHHDAALSRITKDTIDLIFRSEETTE